MHSILLAFSAISCGDAAPGASDAATADGGVARDAATDAPAEDAGAELPSRPYDPTGQQVGFTLSLGPIDPIYPVPEPARNPPFAGMVGRGIGVDAVASDGSLVRRVLMSFSMHDDTASARQDQGVLGSNDGGRSFGGFSSGIQAPPAFALELRDGRMRSYGFVPTARADSGDETRLTLSVHESRDQGTSWIPLEAEVTVPRMVPGLGRVSGHPIELAGGTILLPYYLSYVGDRGMRSELLASEDGGRTFVRRGSIAVPPADTSYPEPDVVELADGSLYAAFRHHVGSTLSTLLFARSTDAGASWSEPQPIRISFGGAAATRTGVNPQLVLLPNGVLVLSSGRPNNFVAISTDPSGVEWTDARETYVNRPSSTSASYGESVLRYHGSSGNTGLVGVESNRLVQFGDNCANGWGCPAADRGFTVDARNRVWRRFIDVATPDVGKIDLLSKLARGAVAVTGDFTFGDAAHPRARVEGAFDGSTDPWSSAVAESDTGTFTIALDRRYDLTRIGLSIRRSAASSATVLVSTDGARFTEVVRADDRTHRAIEYFPLETPVAASFVRVVVENQAPCEPELAGGCAFLNELELYSTVDSFENDPPGAPPRGYVESAGVWVTDYEAGDTRRALRLLDSSDGAIARAVWNGSEGPDKVFEFTLRPIELPGGFLFSIRGTSAEGTLVTVYHFALRPDGSLGRYDFATEEWSALSGPGAIAIGELARIRVDADLERAVLAIDGETIATVPPSELGATALGGHSFASSGTRPTGDHVLVDDVYFQ